MPVPEKKKRKQPRKKSGGAQQDPSLLDKLFGNHVNSLLVALLFFITLIVFLLYIVFVDEKPSHSILTGFFTLLSAFSGFFVGLVRSGNT